MRSEKENVGKGRMKNAEVEKDIMFRGTNKIKLYRCRMCCKTEACSG